MYILFVLLVTHVKDQIINFVSHLRCLTSVLARSTEKQVSSATLKIQVFGTIKADKLY